jgi:lipopolysaccharide/colanic/teichoic acid biosynthesis glycosyltransferase
MIKRGIDILFSLIGLISLFPFFIFISFFIFITSKGGVFFVQLRVGKNNKDFKLYKFRTMFLNSDNKGLLTVGNNDKRITKLGYYLRKNKLDELPQLINVLNGTMSLVGPRPEVRKYVNLYNSEQKSILEIKPGITDLASIMSYNENEILANSGNPEQTYINEIMPIKLELNKQYINEMSLLTDLKIIFKTFMKLINS